MDKRSFLECTGGVLIGLCIIGLLGAFGFSCYLFSSNNVQDVNVQIVMQVDSTGVLSVESLQQAEELKAELVRHEQLLEDRYKHVLEQKENLNDMLTIGGMFLTIILALFGFFGYKSMTSLEDKVMLDAKSTAEETAKETSKSKFESFEQATKKSLEKQVKETVGKEIAKAKNTTKQQIEATLKGDVKGVSERVDDAEDSLSGLHSSMGNLDQKLSVLEDRVKRLENGNGHPHKGRRTLATGGKKL